MAPITDEGEIVEPAYVIPACGCGGKECVGPEPVPWLPWRQCFKFYEVRHATMPLERGGVVAANLARLIIRVRYEHAFCLLGRKQGPIVHSLTLLPKEQIRIYEYDRYRRSTATTNRFSARSSFITLTQRVQDAYSSTKVNSGATVSTFSGAVTEGGAELDLGIISFGGSASNSGGVSTNTHFDVASVSERFSHVAETSSLAVETERSVVVSTFEENESMRSTARLLRNENECRAVTYFIRRVFEVYQLTTRIVGTDVQLGDQWVDIGSAPTALHDDVRKFLQNVEVGAKHDPKVEIALPADGLLYEAELARCCSCDGEHEAKSRLELERRQLENLVLRLEARRRQKRLDAGELEAFEPAPSGAAQ